MTRCVPGDLGIGVRPAPWLPGTFVLNAKSDVLACFYRYFRLGCVSRSKSSKVDQSTPGRTKVHGSPRNIWYRGTLGFSNVTYLHHIRLVSVKTVKSTKMWGWDRRPQWYFFKKMSDFFTETIPSVEHAGKNGLIV